MAALRDRIEEDAIAAGQQGGAGSPNSDGPGNRAWQQATAQLALVQAAEQARG